MRGTCWTSGRRRMPLMTKQWTGLKSFVDYGLGIPLFICVLPVMGVLAMLIKILSPGPALYVQEREGFNGQRIRMLKFRTMYLNADERLQIYLRENPHRCEEWRRFFKLENDPRVIPWIGPFLRKTSLDELPNFWNLLRGDISLVGPRPFPYYHVEEFDPEFRTLRRSVRPGLTGLWQIERGDIQAQTVLDTYYIKNWSIRLDFLILLRTVPVVFRGKAYY